MDQQIRCAECVNPAGCERVWECGRGRTKLQCQMHIRPNDEVLLEVRRNTRLYGMYQFPERVAALQFAGRLRQAFEGNGWSASEI